MKTAFLFPGQGSQFVGMGKSLAENFPAAARRFEEADDALGFSLSKICFEGPAEALKQTEFQQPALLAVSTAAFSRSHQRNRRARLCCGTQPGRIFGAGGRRIARFLPMLLRLVHKRGRYMQEAVPEGVGAMAALLKIAARKAG